MNVHRGFRPARDHSLAADRVVLDRLVESRREMLAFFRRRLGTPEDAEDALQDVCLKAVRAARTLERGEKVDAWLGRIMRHTLVDHYRRRAARQRGEEAFGQELRVQGVEETPTEVQSACACVRAAWSRLRPDQADLLRRADLDAEPRDRIAADLRVTSNALGARLYRARQALKHRIGDLCPVCGAGGFATCDCGHGAGSDGSLAARIHAGV